MRWWTAYLSGGLFVGAVSCAGSLDLIGGGTTGLGFAASYLDWAWFLVSIAALIGCWRQRSSMALPMAWCAFIVTTWVHALWLVLSGNVDPARPEIPDAVLVGCAVYAAIWTGAAGMLLWRQRGQQAES